MEVISLFKLVRRNQHCSCLQIGGLVKTGQNCQLALKLYFHFQLFGSCTCLISVYIQTFTFQRWHLSTYNKVCLSLSLFIANIQLEPSLCRFCCHFHFHLCALYLHLVELEQVTGASRSTNQIAGFLDIFRHCI